MPRRDADADGEASGAMQGPGPPRVPVDWDALEMALTWRSDEWECYLDLRTGEVHQSPAYGRKAEEYELSPDDVDEALAEAHLILVEPLPSSVEYGWMEEFVASVRDPRLRELLDVVLGGRGAFRRFKDALAGYPRERERWFAYRDARVREAMLEWLAENGIEPTAPPPERKP